MQKILTIGTLGIHGRFGNQLFQVCTGLGLARKLGAELQIPADWIGRKIFKVEIPPIRQPIHFQTTLNYLPTMADIARYGCIDIVGYWQYQDAVDLYSREDILKWLPFQGWVLERFPKRTPENHADPCVAIHRRRGDYLSPKHSGRFCVISDKSFHRCLHTLVLAKYGNTQRVNIAEISESKSRYDPYCDVLGLDFLPDFMEMVNADLVIRSNSTFSFWAPIFGANNVYAPLVGNKVGWNDVPFVQGNHPCMTSVRPTDKYKSTDLHLNDTMQAPLTTPNPA